MHKGPEELPVRMFRHRAAKVLGAQSPHGNHASLFGLSKQAGIPMGISMRDYLEI